MTWWLRSRRRYFLVAGIASYLLVLAAVGDTRVPVLSFLGPASVAAAALAPLIVVAAVLAALGAAVPEVEELAQRPVWRYDLSLVVVVVASCLLVAEVLHRQQVQPFATEASRNLLGYLGMALLARAVVTEQAAVAVSTAAVLVGSAFGRGPGGLYPWAWMLAEAASLWATAVALVLFGGGLVALPRTGLRVARGAPGD